MAKKIKTLKAVRKIPKVFEFKVALAKTSPIVWRSFLAHEIIELSELHMLIQMTMGWEASHMFDFNINGNLYGDPVLSDNAKLVNAEGTLLCDVIGSVKKFTYTYDYGDSWLHEVEIIKVLEHDSRLNYPVCIAGENACPPEDCGGPHGFSNLKKILTGKECEAKNEMIKWVGGFYNPTTFDPNIINKHFLWG